MTGKAHLTLVALLATGVAAVWTTAAIGADGPSARAALHDVSGRKVGELSVRPEGGASRVSVRVSGIPKGVHGFHLHTTGVCDPKAVDPSTGAVTPFFTAGGHFDLAQASHGEHSGDLPPLLVGADGTGTASFVTDRFRLRQLMDQDGSAVIVHALPDNFAHIPPRYAPNGPDEATKKTGDAGGRIACGVIR
ncbi:superoxide dismutase family protein [Nonomuraea sp. NPDC050310]|uniref:superoxide dismutase family protein n=1 Tax=unclassified Nonomuraea TaxID=2593643 RepID=UPI0033E4442A